MIKTNLLKGGASYRMTQIGINSLGAAVVGLAIWTGTVVQLPRILKFQDLSIVFAGANQMIGSNRNYKLRHFLNLVSKFFQINKYQVNVLSIPIKVPGGVNAIRSPP